MRELKKQVSTLMRDYKNSWLDEVENAKKENRSLRLSNVMKNEAEIYHKMDIAFLDFEERQNHKKKGFFGR